MFYQLIESRRSVRNFQEKPVEPEKIDMLVEAALRPPSSKGLNPWEFIIVTERELLEKLSTSKPHGASFLKHAPLGIVVCGNPQISDVWVEDCSIASTYILLAAESLGLGACWIQIRNRSYNETTSAQDYISDTLNIPAGLLVESIIAVGYPDKKKPPHTSEELQFEKVHRNSYGTPYK